VHKQGSSILELHGGGGGGGGGGGSGKLLLALATTVILGSESCGTHDHILLSHESKIWPVIRPSRTPNFKTCKSLRKNKTWSWMQMVRTNSNLPDQPTETPLWILNKIHSMYT
jgi:hypothetical protein